MEKYILSPKALVMVSGSSKGTQPKFYSEGYWYKQNIVGYEGLSEYLVSRLLSCSDCKNYVAYEQCQINGKPGCRSKSFLGEGGQFMSFQKLYEIYTGQNLTDKIRLIPEVRDRIVFVVDYVRDMTGFDATSYLSKILALDMLTLNTDRHFNNLGLILNSRDNSVREAPIFDNGNSLLSDVNRFEFDLSLEKNLENVYGQPFSASLEAQAAAAGIGLRIDFKKLEETLAVEPESRALNVLKHQARRYQHLFSAQKKVSISEIKKIADDRRTGSNTGQRKSSDYMR